MEWSEAGGMTARPQVELPELRGAFHAFVKSQGGSVVQREGEYIESMTRLWWTCWKAAIAESEARAVATEANDRRYRWLRDPANNESVSNLIAIYDYGDEALLMDGDDLDAAIDAAMKQETEREAGSA